MGDGFLGTPEGTRLRVGVKLRQAVTDSLLSVSKNRPCVIPKAQPLATKEPYGCGFSACRSERSDVGISCEMFRIRQSLSKFQNNSARLPRPLQGLAMTKSDFFDSLGKLSLAACFASMENLGSFCCIEQLIAILRVPFMPKIRRPKGDGFLGTPEGTRTPNPRNRNPMLYPLSHWRICSCYYSRWERQSKAFFQKVR